MKPVEGARIEHHVEAGQDLPFARDLRAIHAPGHCAGQIARLWRQHGGVLFAADTCINIMGLGWSLGYEDFDQGKRSLRKLSALDFDVACFATGKRSLAMRLAGSKRSGSEWSPCDAESWEGRTIACWKPTPICWSFGRP